MSQGRLLGAGHEAPIIVVGDRSETSFNKPAALPVNHVTGAPRVRQEASQRHCRGGEEGGQSSRVHPVLGTPLKIDPLHLPFEKWAPYNVCSEFEHCTTWKIKKSLEFYFITTV